MPFSLYYYGISLVGGYILWLVVLECLPEKVWKIAFAVLMTNALAAAAWIIMDIHKGTW